MERRNGEKTRDQLAWRSEGSLSLKATGYPSTGKVNKLIIIPIFINNLFLSKSIGIVHCYSILQVYTSSMLNPEATAIRGRENLFHTQILLCSKLLFKKALETGEMAKGLRTLAALLKDPCSIPAPSW